jgi:hypothetical protein
VLYVTVHTLRFLEMLSGLTAQLTLPQAGQSFDSFSREPNILFIDKTKYIEILDATKRYQYLFLRPRRFGKSTFLNMLCRYYDIAQATSFQDLFGGLYIGSNPTSSCCNHLVLKFDLSSIGISSDIDSTKDSFNANINVTLRSFLEYYKDWLGEGWNQQDLICERNASTSLMNVLVCMHHLSE